MRLRTASGMVQAEEFKALMHQVMKAHTADLEAIQITQRVWSATPNSLTTTKLKISLLCPGAPGWHELPTCLDCL